MILFLVHLSCIELRLANTLGKKMIRRTSSSRDTQERTIVSSQNKREKPTLFLFSLIA